ncbi:hypothetical protein [Hymenobacter sp. BT559]|jgi:hypothetical protein|uniref:hypothetical protein n=1 Tax=Hymenobacter sp. BT559 TaxID=2795729 RepID=UPI0018EC4EE4|nr:hypothetical protein [Hymenobacter sp. BT559]MBJ6145741.1 hypothetical protein [Hymenobacter sp. BT559]
MALTVIKGSKVGLYVEKVPGSGQFVRVLCANSLSLNVTTAELTTDCQVEEDDDDPTAGNFANSEPGTITWDAGGEMTQRVADGADADTNVTAGNLLDLQLAGAIMKLRYQLGQQPSAPAYEGKVWINKNGFAGDNKSNATASVGFTGTGPLRKLAAGA